MSLFSSIQVAKNSLLVSQLGLQVTGNNIANANTEGYLRQRLIQTPAGTQKVGGVLVGLGVKVKGVLQQVDHFLEERLRNANSDLANSEAKESTYLQLEAIVGELEETDVSTALSNFFGAVNDVLNEPDSRPVRNLVALEGTTLASTVTQLYSRIHQLREDTDDRVAALSGEINDILNEIGRLNVQVTTAEGGGTSNSDAVGLRDRRLSLLGELSTIIDIQVREQEDGSVTVLSNGEFLVFQGTVREVKTALAIDETMPLAAVHLAATDAPLRSTTGKLAGLISARDDILGGFLSDLDNFAKNLISEFNKMHAGGQGLIGFQSLTGQRTVDETQAPLDQAGLDFAVENGSFTVLIKNRQTGLAEEFDVIVQLENVSDDATLQSLAGNLDAIDGLAAEITFDNHLQLDVESSNLEFAFKNDSSGVLAALGLNTFFEGSSSSDLRVSELIKESPELFAASSGGVGQDTENAVTLAALHGSPIAAEDGDSLADIQAAVFADVTQDAGISRSVAEGFRVFQRTLQGEKLSISGVSIDEEAVNMLAYQRVFQASARYIAAIGDLLDILVNL